MLKIIGISMIVVAVLQFIGVGALATENEKPGKTLFTMVIAAWTMFSGIFVYISTLD